MWFTRTRSAKLAVAAAVTMGLVAASVSPAFADTYTNGTGGFTAVSTLNPPPTECAQYRAYNAELIYASQNATLRVSSGARAPWGENGAGTYKSATLCSGNAGQAIDGFSGTLTIGTSVCSLPSGNYTRNGLNVTFDFTTVTPVSGTCPSSVTATAIIPSRALPVPIEVGPFVIDYLSACNSPIAPQSCLFGPATF